MSMKLTRLNPFGILIEPTSAEQVVRQLDVENLRELFSRDQLLILRGFKTFSSSEDFSQYCESWGKVSEWPFGKVLELIERDNPEDHIFDHSYMPLHWDGMYRQQVPEYQIFHCVQSPSMEQGGRTTFSNTILALKNADPELVKLWKKVTGIYQRKMEFYHSKVVSPVLVKHPYKDFTVIRYNEPPTLDKRNFVNPPELEFSGLSQEELKLFHQSLQAALYAPASFYAHPWQAGDVVIADNFSLLHGREGFTSRAPRHLQRVHVLSHTPFNNPGLESYQ